MSSLFGILVPGLGFALVTILILMLFFFFSLCVKLAQCHSGLLMDSIGE